MKKQEENSGPRGGKLRKVRELFRYLRPYRKLFVLGMVCLAVGSMAGALFPFIVGKLINSAVGTESWWLDQIGGITLLLLGLLIVQAVLSFLRTLIFAKISERAMKTLRMDLFAHLLHLPVTFLEGERVGQLTSRITTDVEKLQQVFAVTIAELLRQGITILVGLGFILALSPRLCLVVAMVLPPLVFSIAVFGRLIRKLSREKQDATAHSNAVVEESLRNVRVVKAYTNEGLEIRRYGSILDDLLGIAVRAAGYRGAFMSFMVLGVFTAIVLVIWQGAGLVKAGSLAIGDLTAFVMYMLFIGGGMSSLGNGFNQIMSAAGATERLSELLEELPEPALESGEVVAVKGEIRFEAVDFAYPSRPEVPVLEQVSFRIAAGEKVAFAGKSGAGKSTIVQLLLRFYAPGAGEIVLDGVPLESWALCDLRGAIGIVPQEMVLFSGTVRENILYGRPDADEATVLKVAEQANVMEFIAQFPEGLDTVVGERGVKLSGGQRQRIAIARAMLRDPVILILDEATSSLDNHSERLVQEALDVLMEGRTSIVIAHRLHTVRNVDRIYVLEAGKIKEMGTHADLFHGGNGTYRKLVEAQTN